MDNHDEKINNNHENTILFTIGRMNPPTSGHMLLIKNMIQRALNLKLTQVYLILSATVDNKKNPLSCGEKRKLLLQTMIQSLKEKMVIEFPSQKNEIEQMKIQILCMDDPINSEKYGNHPILKCINYLLFEKYHYPRDDLKMLLMIGQDRKKDYFWIQKILQERKPEVILNIQDLERPEGAMSSTYIRNLAINGDWVNFNQNMLESGMNHQQIQSLYDEIRNKMNNEKNQSTTKKRKIQGGKTKKRNQKKKSQSKTGKNKRCKHKKLKQKIKGKTKIKIFQL